MANVLQYVTLFQQELDMQVTVGSTTGWMEKMLVKLYIMEEER